MTGEHPEQPPKPSPTVEEWLHHNQVWFFLAMTLLVMAQTLFCHT